MILIYLLFYRVRSGPSWSVCDKPCGSGEQKDQNGNKRICNIEDCSIYEDNILQDSKMDLKQNSPWKCYGGCTIQSTADSYDGHGFYIRYVFIQYESVSIFIATETRNIVQ